MGMLGIFLLFYGLVLFFFEIHPLLARLLELGIGKKEKLVWQAFNIDA